MQSLAFPIRLQENGLLRRDGQTASILSLLQMMARTPAGSWVGCPSFGLRDLFEHGRQRADIALLAMERANEALNDLGIHEFTVSEVVREVNESRDTDVYGFTLVHRNTQQVISTTLFPGNSL